MLFDSVNLTILSWFGTGNGVGMSVLSVSQFMISFGVAWPRGKWYKGISIEYYSMSIPPYSLNIPSTNHLHHDVLRSLQIGNWDNLLHGRWIFYLLLVEKFILYSTIMLGNRYQHPKVYNSIYIYMKYSRLRTTYYNAYIYIFEVLNTRTKPRPHSVQILLCLWAKQ